MRQAVASTRSRILPQICTQFLSQSKAAAATCLTPDAAELYTVTASKPTAAHGLASLAVPAPGLWRLEAPTWRASTPQPISTVHQRYTTSDATGQEELLQHWVRVLDTYTDSKKVLSQDPGREPGTPGPPTTPAASSPSEPASASECRRLEAQMHLGELFRVFSARMQGGVVPELFSQRLVTFYRTVLRDEDKPWFLRLICTEMGLRVEDVDSAAAKWRSAVERAQAGGLIPAEALYRAAAKLGSSTRPLYTQLLLPLAQLEEGIGFLVELRSDLLSVIKQDPAFSASLRAMSEHLRQALAGWFSPGLLQLRRISWDTCSGDMLEKIMRYEAVHPMHGWGDLRRRLDPRDRRVYAFVHPCLPGDPLVVLHTALTQQPAQRLAPIMEPRSGGRRAERGGQADREGGFVTSPGPDVSSPAWEEPASSPVAAAAEGVSHPLAAKGSSAEQPTVAVFYSISSTQAGLSGVDLGHFLIKKVAEMVQAEFPSVRLLVTLSPIPNLRDWLMARLAYEAAQEPSDTRTRGAPTEAPGSSDASEEDPSRSSNGAARAGQPVSSAWGGDGATAANTGPKRASGEASPAARPAATTWLLSVQDGCDLLAAAQSLPDSESSGKRELLAAAGHLPGPPAGRDGAGEPVRGGSAPPPLLQPGKCAALLSVWLAGDRWRRCPEEFSPLFRALLMRLAARYLVLERRRNLALDPVANFHLRNGSQLWRVNWGADISERGMQNSFGIMVNYRYDLELVYRRNQDYLMKRKINASAHVERLLEPKSPPGAVYDTPYQLPPEGRGATAVEQ